MLACHNHVSGCRIRDIIEDNKTFSRVSKKTYFLSDIFRKQIREEIRFDLRRMRMYTGCPNMFRMNENIVFGQNYNSEFFENIFRILRFEEFFFAFSPSETYWNTLQSSE